MGTQVFSNLPNIGAGSPEVKSWIQQILDNIMGTPYQGEHPPAPPQIQGIPSTSPTGSGGGSGGGNPFAGAKAEGSASTDPFAQVGAMIPPPTGGGDGFPGPDPRISTIPEYPPASYGPEGDPRLSTMGESVPGPDPFGQGNQQNQSPFSSINGPPISQIDPQTGDRYNQDLSTVAERGGDMSAQNDPVGFLANLSPETYAALGDFLDAVAGHQADPSKRPHQPKFHDANRSMSGGLPGSM